MAFVYLHTNKQNGKAYCGETIQDPIKRWGKNGNEYLQKKNGKYEHPAFAAAILKYGWDAFDHEIIFECETEEQALNFEYEYIEAHNLRGENGYNCCIGGGRPPILQGDKNPFYNTRPDKAIEASIASRTGVPLSEEHKEKISNSQKGIHKDNSAAVEKRKQKIICVETNIIYDSIEEAAKDINRNHSNILVAIRKNGTCAGFHWRYLDKNSDGYRTDNEKNSSRE